jgi:hypothetical protein
MHPDDAEASEERHHLPDRTAVHEARRGSQPHERLLADGLEEEHVARVDGPAPVAPQVQKESLSRDRHGTFSHELSLEANELSLNTV